jgi:hypothetical protein
MRMSISRTKSRWLRAGLATGAIAAVVVGAATPAFAAVVPVTLSATTGPSGSSTTTITATSTTAFLSGYTAPGAIFSVPACPSTYNTATVTPTASVGNVPVPSASVKKLSNLKVGITVPAGVASVGSAASTKYNVCIYGTSATGGALLGTAVYNVALAPVITSISPTSGPALGGGTITVTGTGFPTTAGSITATIGGSPLLSVTPLSATSFTAVTPAHAAANNLTLSVSTLAGTLNKTNAYSYTNGIVVGPNTGPNTGPIDVDVQGVGFLSMDFSTTTGSTPDDTKSHVYLVRGVYDATGTAPNKAVPEITECTDVLLIGDTELICTLQLDSALITTGATAGLSAVGPVSTVRTVTDGALTTSSPTNGLTSATAAFSTADVGLGVSGTGIASGTWISAYVSPTVVTLSAAPTPTAVTTVTIGGSRSVTAGATNSNTTVSGTTLYTADIGRAITGPGIPPGTTVASTTTISQSATATATGLTFTVGGWVPVPTDLYTVTVVDNGAPATTPTNTKTNISSGSTFTVAPY